MKFIVKMLIIYFLIERDVCDHAAVMLPAQVVELRRLAAELHLTLLALPRHTRQALL